MADIITGIRQVVQDLVAPDLKAIQAKQDALVKQLDAQGRQEELHFKTIMSTLEAFRAEMRAELNLLRTANELEVQRQLSPFAERVAAIEGRLEANG